MFRFVSLLLNVPVNILVIKYINDLVNENGEFYQQNEFTMKTGIQTHFLEYNGLIKAIKHYLQIINFLLLFLITAAGCCAVWRP